MILPYNPLSHKVSKLTSGQEGWAKSLRHQHSMADMLLTNFGVSERFRISFLLLSSLCSGRTILLGAKDVFLLTPNLKDSRSSHFSLQSEEPLHSPPPVLVTKLHPG